MKFSLSNYMLSVIKSNMNDTIKVNKEEIRMFLEKYKDSIDLHWVDLDEIAGDVYSTLPNEISRNDFYNYIADHCVSKTSKHFDYNKLASMICIDRLHATTPSDMLEVANLLYRNGTIKESNTPLISDKLLQTIITHHKRIAEALDMSRDYHFDYFGIKTLERSYLLKIVDTTTKKKMIVERPQHMIMRVALGIHFDEIEDALETYNLISNRYFTHATPTLFNAGTNRPQLSSCFLLGVDDDLNSILGQVKQIGLISKWAGGIGVHLSSIRARGSIIKGTNGTSDGLLPLCILLNKLAKYVNQGGKRPGSIACYTEPWHADIFDFCELRKQNTGSDDTRARDLFLALWIPDLFMKRVEADEVWSLMCPNECPELNNTYGEVFERLYTKYEEDKKYKKQIKARELWKHILECQIETGFPYMCYKDHVNRKSNQKNLGTIKSSNLCSEIVEYSDADNTAVCNLASICLPRFVTYKFGMPVFDYKKLIDVTRVIVRNLNKVIDINYYPTESARRTNETSRPIGIGVQGTSDVYNLFGFPYDSEEANYLNKKIFETIYYASVDESKELAKKYGHYRTFRGSPFSKGKLQYHLWGMKTEDLVTSKDYPWDKLVEDVQNYGTRNSLLTALMPTAGTSQIMKCYESFEPFLSNVFLRTTMAGEFIVINENLMKDLIKEDLWDDDMRKLIIINNGSVQDIEKVPQKLKNIYKTAFELKLKSIISQSADRAPFIDQSQSMNLFMKKPDPTILTSAHYYAWERGLKTGMYYLRTTSAVNPIQFGINVDDIMRLTGRKNALELISSDYNITSPALLASGLPAIEKPDPDDKKNTKIMCKYIPGKVAEGCEMCGS